jgi:hypothetical protein
MACNLNSRTRVAYAAKSRALLRKWCISMSALSPSIKSTIPRRNGKPYPGCTESSSREVSSVDFCATILCDRQRYLSQGRDLY